MNQVTQANVIHSAAGDAGDFLSWQSPPKKNKFM